MASVYRRQDRWYVRYRDADGRLRRLAVKVKLRAQAVKMAVELEANAERIRMGLALASKPRTWDELCRRYEVDAMPNLRNQAGAKSQMKLYAKEAFSGRMLQTISPADINGFVTGLRKRGLGDSSRETVRMRLRAIFTYAVESLEWLALNPVARSKPVKVPHRAPIYLTVEEVQASLVHAPDWLRAVMAVALYCGLRRGELAALEWEDVDIPGRVIRVRRTAGSVTTKGNKERSVAMPDSLVPYLVAQLASVPEGCRWVFPTRYGKARSKNWKVSTVFRRVLADAGIKRNATFRATRSTWATHAYLATQDPFFVQHQLGHADVKTSQQHYIHVLPEHRKEQANRLAYGEHKQRTNPQKLLPAGDVVEKTTAETGASVSLPKKVR